MKEKRQKEINKKIKIRKQVRKYTALLLLLVTLTNLEIKPYAAEKTNKNIININSEEDLIAFAKACSLDTYSEGEIVELNKDIELSEEDFTISTFGGTFKGNGHTISGLKITKEGWALGFFRYIREGGQVENLNIEGLIEPEGSKNSLGGIAGINYGTIDNCTFRGEVTGEEEIGGVVGLNDTTGVIKNSVSFGAVNGSRYVGGIAGKNKGMIYKCTNEGEINTTFEDSTSSLSDMMSSETKGKISGVTEVLTDPGAFTEVGGITGYSSGIIQYGVNKGGIGYPHVGYNIGGIAGRQSGYISDCSNAGLIQGRKDVGGIVGQMEPYILLQYSEDTLQRLNKELEELTKDFDGLLSHMGDSSLETSAQLDEILDYMNDANTALNELASQTVDYTNETVTSVNNSAERISTVLSQSASVFDEFSTMADYMGDASLNIADAIGCLGSASDALKEATGPLSDGFLAISGGAEEFGKASKKISKAISLVEDAMDNGGADLDNAKSELEQAIKEAGTALESMITAFANLEEAYEKYQTGDVTGAVEEIEGIMAAIGEFTENAGSFMEETKEALNDISDAVETISEGTFDAMNSFVAAFDKIEKASDYLAEGFELISTSIDSFNDTLDLVGDAATNFSDAFEDLSSATDNLSNASDKLSNIVSELFEEPLITLPVLSSSYSENIDELSEAFQGVFDTTKELNNSLTNASQTVINDLKAMNERISGIGDVLKDSEEDATKEGKGLIQDISDEDIANVKEGKVFQCENQGAVSGDINTGGITGTMALDFSFDPESEITTAGETSLNFVFNTKAILQACVNRGEVTSKKNQAGGMVGKMELGTIYACENYGKVVSTEGSYVGGIAGSGKALIKSSYVLAELEGKSYIGGIAGSGEDICDCYTYVVIDSTGENLGAIAGKADGEISSNYFVQEEWDGIDDISYEGKASPLEYKELISKEKVPEEFKTFHLYFVADDKEIAVIDFQYGDSLSEDKLPEVPSKEGYYGTWADYNYSNLTFSATIEAEYEPFTTVIANSQVREGTNKPVMLADSLFIPGATLTLSSVSKSVELEKLDKGQLLEAWAVKAEGRYGEGEGVTLHYLPPSETGDIHIWEWKDSKWEEISYKKDGSYLLFKLDENTGGNSSQGAVEDTVLAVTITTASHEGVLLPVVIILIAAILLYAIVGKRIKRKRNIKH